MNFKSTDELLYIIKQQLIDGVKNRKNPYHYITFANCDDNQPEVRMVVNRAVDFQSKTINFHSDYRSSKIQQLQKNPKVSLLFYNAETRMQLRIKGSASINYKNDLSLQKWQETKNFSRLCYMHKLAPSSVIIDDWEKNKALDNGTNEEGYENFAVISTRFNSIDCVLLGHENHRRFLFEWNLQNKLSAKELAP